MLGLAALATNPRVSTLGALLALLLAVCAASSFAQHALRGKRLYLDTARVVGSGVSCVDCHAGLPPGLFGIGRAANNPAIVENAVNSIAQMAPFRSRLAAADYADLAAYIGNPGVASPAVRITTTLPNGAAGAGDRIEFGDLAAGTASGVASLRITNAGAVALTLTAAPTLGGTNASEFSIESTDCAIGVTLGSQQSYRVDLRFRPAGAPASRTARVSVSHDWVGGIAAVALLGSVGATLPEPAQPSGGGASHALGLVMLRIAAWWRRCQSANRATVLVRSSPHARSAAID